MTTLPRAIGPFLLSLVGSFLSAVDAHAQPQIVQCASLDPLPSGAACGVTQIGDTSKLLRGTVLVPGTVYRGGEVAVDKSGIILCVGCDCAASVPTATTITCPAGVISPGLINTHDHLTFTQNNPVVDTKERYEHRHQWREKADAIDSDHNKIVVESIEDVTVSRLREEKRAWGELRFLLTGTTSTAGQGAAKGFLRSLDDAAYDESLDQLPVTNSTFPLGDGNDSDPPLISDGSCGYLDIDKPIRGPYQAHVAEGINAFARNEFLCVSSTANGGHDLAGPHSSFVHGIPLNANDLLLMATEGTALSWSPRSNLRLYGDTTYVTAADRLGVRIALGTDWTPTGSMNLLRELRCADHWNQQRLAHYFNDEQLWLMVTANAASSFDMDDAIGILAPGREADIAIFNATERQDHRAVIDAAPQDVVLVMRAGKVLYGDANLAGNIPRSPTRNDVSEILSICGVSKRLYARGEISKSLATLRANIGNPPIVGDGIPLGTGPEAVYPAVFCETPTDEPVCEPQRVPVADNGFPNFPPIYTGVISPGIDSDGDGIADADDDCPDVFNPIRPLGRTQTDSDFDGIGDPCDSSP